MRILLSLVLAVFLIGCADGPSRTAQSGVYDAAELVVLVDSSPEKLIASAQALGYAVKRQDQLSGLRETIVVFQLPPDRTIPAAIEEVEALQPGVTAGANHAYRIQARSVGDARLEFANQMIGWPSAGCPARTRIGLIDTGVGPAHPGLADGRIVQQSFVDGGISPVSDHGALMAELLVGPGRLTGASLFSANVVDPGRGNGDVAAVDAIVRGVDWMAREDVKVVNISLAGPYNKILDRGLRRAATHGMVIVGAAGNLGPTAPPQYPAALPFVLAVTAVDRNSEVYRRAIRGPHIDISAPGVDIMIRVDGKLRIFSGTSAAAPYVAATIAADDRLTNVRSTDAVRAHLSRRAIDLGQRGNDAVFGAGLIIAPTGCDN